MIFLGLQCLLRCVSLMLLSIFSLPWVLKLKIWWFHWLFPCKSLTYLRSLNCHVLFSPLNWTSHSNCSHMLAFQGNLFLCLIWDFLLSASRFGSSVFPLTPDSRYLSSCNIELPERCFRACRWAWEPSSCTYCCSFLKYNNPVFTIYFKFSLEY